MTLLDPLPAASEELDEIHELGLDLSHRADLDPLLDRIGDARFVAIGEASHGTSEYYRWRAELTRRLITERGFSFVAVEGDWPDCFAVNQWLKGRTDQDRAVRDVLRDFERWPTWMWANDEVAEFVAWLRDHNLRTGDRVGFYGLDVYSLWESIRVILGYLDERHPEALAAAHAAFRCFEPFGEDPQRYAWATRMVPSVCENEVVELLVDVRRASHLADDDDPEAELDAVQNAEVLAGAERYYRTMVSDDNQSWNVRDCHMADTLDRLMGWHGAGAKAVVWEHNTHIGDARATDMAAAGMVNVGQLLRERHGDDGVVLVGFSGYAGSVIAGSSWGAPMQRLNVPAAPPGTHEHLVHEAIGADSLFVFPDVPGPWLRSRRGHRAIGVVYHPGAERRGNWVPSVLGRRYDVLCALDGTTALHPLHAERPQPAGERETAPWGL